MKIDLGAFDFKKIILDKRVWAAAAVVAVGIVASSAYTYWVGRPEYSVSALRKAISTKDTASVERYISFDYLYGNAFDEAVTAASSQDADAFSRTMADRLVKDEKDAVVKKLKDATLNAFTATDESGLDSLSNLGMFGNAVKILCHNIISTEPDILLSDIRIIKKEETISDIRFVFYDTKGQRQLSIDARMYKQPDGKWKVMRFLNTRQAYRSAEFILDKSYEEARIAAEEELAKTVAKREAEAAKYVVLPEEERLKGSARVQVLLADKKPQIIRGKDTTIYRFGAAGQGTREMSLTIYNDIIVHEESGRIRNMTSLILKGKIVGEILDFDRIYFNSQSKGMLVDVRTWEKKGLATKIVDNKNSDGRGQVVIFTATTDDFVDIYKLVFEDSLRVSFYLKNQLVTTFVAGEKMKQSIKDFMEIKNIVKDKLFAGGGEYNLLPVDEETIKKARVEMAEEKAKATKEARELKIKPQEVKPVDGKPQDKDAQDDKGTAAEDKAEQNKDKENKIDKNNADGIKADEVSGAGAPAGKTTTDAGKQEPSEQKG